MCFSYLDLKNIFIKAFFNRITRRNMPNVILVLEKVKTLRQPPLHLFLIWQVNVLQ